MGTDKPRYLVRIKGCFYWRPTPRMKRAGFCAHALGKNELQAKLEATRLSAEWDAHRFGARNDPSVMVYPHGSLGQAYNRALALRVAERKSKGIIWTRQQKARDDWPRAWRWIGPAFGDYDPLAVVAEDLLALRAKVAERVSESEAFRVIKVWRALWAKLTPLGYTVPPGSDPSLTFANSAPPPRQEVWPQRDVLRLAQRAWRRVLWACRPARRRMGHDAKPNRRALAYSRSTPQRWSGIGVHPLARQDRTIGGCHPLLLVRGDPRCLSHQARRHPARCNATVLDTRRIVHGERWSAVASPPLHQRSARN